jgi:TonB family protein
MHIERTRAFITALSVLLLCSAVHAQTPDPRQHLQELARANSLELEGSQPWHLLMTFQLNDLDGKPKDSGTIEEWWVSPQSHRLEIRSRSYNFTDPAPSDASAPATRNRESYLVSELLNQVTDPIPDYGDFNGLVASEATRAFGKVTLSCIIVARPPRRPSQFCFEPGTSTLRGYVDESQFSAVRNNMAKFRGIYLGLDNSLAFSGKPAISGHVDKLESFHPDGSIVLSTAPSGTPSIIPGAVLSGRAVSKPQPDYPEAARGRHIMGTVVLCATISRQGTISSLDVISSPSLLLTGSAMQAVKQWTYQPYLLNGSPVEVETTITVNYNLN